MNARATAARRGLRVAYVLWNNPAPSELFIQREMDGLRRLGVVIDVLVLDPPHGRDAAPHPTGPFHAPPWFHPARLRAFGLPFRTPGRFARLLAGLARVGFAGGAKGPARAVRMGWLAAFFLASEIPPPDLVHAHFANLPTVFARLFAFALAKPWGFSVHAHDLYAESLPLADHLRECSHVLTCSHVAARELRGRIRGELRGKVRTIYHGLELGSWRRCGRREQRSRACILAVGRLVPKKGFHVLIEACGLLRMEGLDFECDIVGEGPERGALQRRIHERSLADRVRLAGWHSEAELQERYRRSSVLAVPSVVAADGDRDNIPNTLVEGLLMEVPVVASDLPAIREVLAPERAGILVPPGDPQALSTALLEVCTRAEVDSELCGRARAYAESHFDLSRTSLRLKEIFALAAAPEARDR
jgi:glycosyltransferase involved in cell wall biosynthesis